MGQKVAKTLLDTLCLFIIAGAILFLNGCEAGFLNPNTPDPPPEEPDPIAYEIKVECPPGQCPPGTAHAGEAPLNRILTLNTTEDVETVYWSLDESGGIARKGKRVTGTWTAVDDYTITAEIHTVAGEKVIVKAQISATEPPDPLEDEDDRVHVIRQGSRCTFERWTPRTVNIGETFQVKIAITVHEHIHSYQWDDGVWFLEFKPQQVVVQTEIDIQPQTVTYVYDVRLRQRPDRFDLWMEGTLSCAPFGLGNSEILTLRSPIKVNPNSATTN